MAGLEGFPDVTLAEQKPLSNETDNLNKVSKANDTVVVLRSCRRQRSGYFVSRTRLSLIVVCGVLILIISVLLTVFLTREMCSTKSSDNNPGQMTSKLMVQNESSNTDQPVTNYSSEHHWSGLRLPRSVIPSHYDLELKINLDKFDFIGSCNITAYVNISTRFILFHKNFLDLNESTIKVRTDLRHYWTIHKQTQLLEYHFHLLEMEKELPAGLTIYIEIGLFAGVIREDLRGLYRSSYKASDGSLK